MDAKTKVAAGLLGILVFFSTPVFSLLLGSAVICYLSKRKKLSF